MISSVVPWDGRAWAGGTQLPVPCVATSCGANTSGFVTTGAATAVQSGKTLSVNQTSNTATLNWSSFNISSDGKVVFTQPSSTSIALNKIFDTNPSAIYGSLTANGQLYLINANGFLFGPGASVNVGGLLASSLNLSDATFASGILAPGLKGTPALTPFVDSSGNVISQPITVDAGATITAADQGRILLAAPNVTNGGSLNAPDGQVILAAGQNLYLQASSDSNLRGLVVEVDGGGTAANQLTGAISTPRGNVTLTGLMVNQNGRVSATTSVSANGSIILQAADTFPSNYSPGTAFSATRGGTVELGPGSVTEVLPETSDTTTTAVAAQAQLPSQVTITGQQVLMHDAVIDAPSGQLNVTAAADPENGVQSTDNPNAEIRIDAGTSINLAGSQAQLPMDANLVNVQLRSNELADDPTQRGGALQSTPTNTVTVTVDVRADNGAGSPIADLQSAIAAVGQDIAQRTETGGTASFKSEGDMVMSPGANINVSGGATTYLGGTIQTSYLVGANGQLYNIGSANPLLTYTGVVNPTFTQTYDKWGIQEVIPTPGLSQYQSGYVQGAAAGSIQFAAPSMSLAGSLQGSAVSGLYQRSAPPSGGTLIIGVPTGVVSTSNNLDYLSPSVVFASSETPISVADGSPLPVQALQLPTAYLTSDGFTNTQIYSNTNITLPAGLPLQLLPGASLSLVAPRIDVDSSIASVAGNLLLENVVTAASPSAYTPGPASIRPGVVLGQGVTLDVSGQWTNDATLSGGVGTAPTYLNGGKITLQLTQPDSELVLGDNVSLIANGGAWLQSGGAVSYGAGGAITLDASPSTAAIQFGLNPVVQGFGAGTASGGSFTLYATRINVAEGGGAAWTQPQTVDDLTNTSGPVLDLYAPLFSNYGFSSINLTATGATVGAASDVLTIASGTSIDAETSTLALTGNYTSMPTGGSIAAFATPKLLPLYERPVGSVSLSVIREGDDAIALGNANYGQLDVQAGATIAVDPGGSIALNGEGGVTIDGTLRAPGGTITAYIPAPGDVNSNNADVTDPGFLATLGINIGSSALLDVSGTTIMQPNNQGLLTGTVLPGGAVKLTADRGTITTDAGSMIDFSGTSALLDVTNGATVGSSTRETLASAGGSFAVSAGESISLLGDFVGSAGVGSGGTAAAGSLSVTMSRSANSLVQGPGESLPAAPLEIELLSSTAGGSPSPPSADTAVLGAQQITGAGVDSVSLQADSNIFIDASLSLARQLALNSPSISSPTTATLSAPFVMLGNSIVNAGVAVPQTPSAGNGNLTVAAQQMVLQGNFAVQGTSQVTLSSSGDIQLQGTSANGATGPTSGSLITNGSLAIDALRVYPDTYTAFTITSLPGNGGTVSIGSTGASPGAPLSAGGAVAITADNISVTGALYVPFGSINLAANNALTLATGSVVSVSGAGLTVPFGQTEQNQGEWVYETPNGTLNTITGVPTKQISLSAPSISVQSGATANIQGGGSLYAYEWVPGTGGSYDNLNATCCASTSNVALTSYPNLYAILPSARGQAGPYDPQESVNSVAGQTVYLSGGAGIAAGYYALLPARYALEPGAVLIQLEPTIKSATGGQVGALANGTPVIGGFLSVGTTGLNTGGTAQYEGVAVYPSGYAQSLASYTISDAAEYFGALASAAGTGPVSEPADAGTFTLSVTPSTRNSLSLEGSVLTAAATGGRGAQINLSAPDLEITGPNGASASGAITVSGSVLQSWNASSITLGGASANLPVTTGTGSSTSTAPAASEPAVDIAVAANTVTVDSGVQLVADQIELVALQSIDVQAGASLASTSGKNGTPLQSLPAQQTVYLTSAPYATVTDAAANQLASPALLAVSDLAVPIVSRAASTTSPGATIEVASGATLASGGALSFDAPGQVTLAGTLSGKGASWSLSSGSVAFVGASASSDTLNIDGTLLASLQQAGALRIASEGNIDIDTPVSLGVDASGATPTLSSLTLVGNAINNNASGNSVLGGASVTLAGNIVPTSAAPAPAAATAGSGSNLSLVANTLTLGPGDLSIDGFAQTTAQVAGAFVGTGSSYLNVGGNLNINAVELTAAPVASDLTSTQGVTQASGTTLASTGALAIGAPTALAAGTTLPTLIGGSLTLSAPDIEDAGAILAPSGLVALNSSGNLHLASTASISTAGTAVQAVTQTAYSPGGLVQLTAAGNMNLDAGSSISVAGSAEAPAGTLGLNDLGGTLTMAGSIDGAAPAGNAGGSLIVAAGSLAGGLSSLAANPGLGGFNQALSVRVQSGDLDLANGAAITANSVTLTADSGAIGIAGVVSAPSAAQRGFIDLSGGAGVTLASTGQLHADGSGSTGRGGEIDINSVTSNCNATSCTSTGSITLMNGSVISAEGAAQMGEVVLRAPASLASNDVAINAGQTGLGADLSNAGQVIVEPVLVTPTSSATIGSDLGNAANGAASFLTAAATTIAARLTSPSATPVAVQAGIELQDANPGDALILPAFDFSQYSTQGQVINLAVRAAGSISINGTISDGFNAPSGGGDTTLTNLPSGSLSFVAGADLASANPTSVLAASAASLTLGSQSVVRTGTGDINLAAAGDVVFQSDTGGGASVYTAGLAGAPAASMGRSNRLGSFPTDGGNVMITAGAAVVGAPFLDVNLDGGDFSVTGWQPRGLVNPKTSSTQSSGPAQYGVNFDEFDWNVGALGGGDVTVQAGSTIGYLSAATADSSPDGNTTIYGAGGGLKITAVGDIGSSQFYVADGTGTVTTNAGMPAILAGSSPGTYLGSTFAIGSSAISVWARQGVQVDAVYNPTYVPASAGSQLSQVNFFTYSANSALNLSSTDGIVQFDLEPVRSAMGVLLGPTLLNNSNGFLNLPADLAIQALQQNIDLNISGSGAILFPSSTGQLNLFAGQDILGNSSTLAMADSFASAVWTAAAPQTLQPALEPLFIGGLAEFQGVIHAGDPNPALITAGTDIDDLGLAIPKAADVSAGRDIVNLDYQGQNTSPADTTLITAGRDIVYNGSSSGMSVGGPGSFDIFAGRNVNLGISGGITTTGDLSNANLATAQGADLTLAVGYGTAGADYSSFLTNIIDPSATYQGQLVDYVQTQTGQSGLSFAQAQSAFEGLSQSQQATLINNVFFNELLLSGRAANSGTGVGFTEGYAAIDALYPGSRNATASAPSPYDGSLSLISSQIYTLSGGNISILVPGGDINVGLAFTPAGVIQKPASELGIVAEGSGNVDIYSLGDVNVNASRIFTLGGGNILIWSDQGSIDAGNGSKSSLSVPPPVILVNADGSISVDYGASLSAGSGIRTIQTNPSVPPGDVDLDAPVGTVNAGDAGIGASGNINIAAAHVIGALNINFGGSATGVPSDLSGLAASLSGVSSVATSATTSSAASAESAAAAAKEVAPLAQTALSWLEVFVTGLGEENCKQDDVECLKRQKSAAP
jgi:filamentous hemagglutinin family protein